MYLKIRMKTKFRDVQFRGRSTLQNIVEFYLSDHGRPYPPRGEPGLTMMITVGNFSLPKIHFWLVAKQKRGIGNSKLLL